jgi:hypothetical protein
VKTIRRNATKKIAALATEVMATRLHELSGGFVGVPVPVTAAFDALARYDFAKLTDHENGKYTVHVHGNQWFYLYTAQWFQGLGRDAYGKANPIAAPAADAAMISVLNGMDVGTGAAELMLEWQKGWNAAAEEAAQAALADA